MYFMFSRSVCLLIQVAMPCAWYAKSPVEMTVKGGTNAEMAPQIDYMTMVWVLSNETDQG
jgi:RNA 3'-terminal phosphate cyclase (ATP)